MKTYDVWFIPDRSKEGSGDVPACPVEYRGLTLEYAKLILEAKRSSELATLGEFKIKASSTWARAGLSWWAGRSEERYHVGPYPTREQALLAALTEDIEQVHLCEAAYGKPSFPEIADQIIERFEETNEELGDEDEGFSLTFTAAQEKDLQASIESTFHAWIDRHKIKSTVFMFNPCYAEAPIAINLSGYLKIAIPFSYDTFGPGARSAGVIEHIGKEIAESEKDPAEWVDVAILALDGAWRAFGDPTLAPNVERFVNWAVHTADYWVVRQPYFSDLWGLVQAHPSDPGLWIGLHIAAMRQWEKLYYLGDKGLPAYHELFAKLTLNQLRVWPDWQGNEGNAIEHDRSV